MATPGDLRPAHVPRPLWRGASWRAFAACAVLALALLGVLPGAQDAGASVFTAPGPGLPGSVTVGRPFKAHLGVGNYSTPPESLLISVLAVAQIDLVLACSRDVNECAGGAEAGVFRVASKARATSGPATCRGNWRVTEAVPGVFRFTPPGGEGSLQLANQEICVVEFTATALRLPSVDTSPAVGNQTLQVASSTAQVLGVLPVRTSSPAQTTVIPGSPPFPTVGDYDGDGTTDGAVYRPSAGTWYLDTANPQAVVWGGLAGDVPVPGDYDGNGTTDVAIYRPSAGTWYLRMPTPHAVVWGGVSGDLPVPGDYDGNRTTDVAIYRPSAGTWYLRTPTAQAIAWGGGRGDVPVPGDYDGNGTTDVAVYRPSNGAWYLRTPTPAAVAWGGGSGDVPVPGDYDGDAITDVAVYRPSQGGWFLRGSGGGTAYSVWGGAPGDLPVVVPPALRGL